MSRCRRCPQAALRALAAYPFPGNVRELENILERATALYSGSAIEAEDLQLAPDEMGGENPGRGSETLDDYLNRLERQAILEALAEDRGQPDGGGAPAGRDLPLAALPSGTPGLRMMRWRGDGWLKGARWAHSPN